MGWGGIAAWTLLTVMAFMAVVAMGSGPTTGAQASQGPQIIELAQAQVTAVQGTHTLFHPGGRYGFRAYAPVMAGDAITFSVTVHKSGNYRVLTTAYKDGAEGIYKLEVDGVEVGQKDFYLNNKWDAGRLDLEAGTHTITYRCAGQNPASGGIGVKLGNLQLR